MTVEENRDCVAGNNGIDRFPIGMRVLAVDDDPTCLKLLDVLLRKCQYQVTTTNQAITALKMLRENRNRFDLIISDVYMPDMDGFKLLELVGLEMDLPVIMLSGNSDPKLVMKGITHGACDYLVKPVRLEELRNIWQHVIRRKVESKSNNNNNNQEKSNQGSEGGLEQESDQNGKVNRKRKEEDEDVEENDHENDDSSTQKKPRVVWSIDLHRKFVSAVNQLGLEKAVPKRILDLMNVEGLTRENVASHLQKYRLYLKRISQQANMVVAFGGSKDASSYMRMSQLNGLGDFQTFSGSGRPLNAALSSYSAYTMLGRLNTATGMTLQSLTSPPLTQKSQNLTKFQPVISSTLPSHQKSNPFQGLPSSFDLDLFQQTNKQDTQLMDFNSIDESRIFMCSSSFMGPSVTKSESLNLVSSSSSFLDQSGIQPSNFSLNSMPMSHVQLPHNNSQRYGFSAATASIPTEPQIGGIVGDIVQNVDPILSNENHGQYKQDYTQYSNNSFSTLSASASLNSGGLGGPVSQAQDQIRGVYDRSNGSALSFTQKSNVEQRMESGDDLQGGFVADNRYDPLDDLMNGIMKREQEPLILTDGEFRFDPYAFGSCI